MDKENVVIILDVQNLYHASKKYGGSKVSYSALKDAILGDNREMLHGYAYAAHRKEQSSVSFYKALQYSGFKVNAKQIKYKNDEKPSSINFMGDIASDIFLTLDPTEDGKVVDTIVVCSGNGALFDVLQKVVSNYDVKVEIWGFEDSTSKKLLENFPFHQISSNELEGVKSDAQSTE